MRISGGLFCRAMLGVSSVERFGKKMAEQEADEADASSAGAGKGNLLVMLLVVLMSVAGGVLTPFVVSQLNAGQTDSGKQEETKEKAAVPDPEEEVEYIPFGEVTVNLDEARFSRFLKIDFSLQVPKSQRVEIEAEVKAKDVVFKNWLQVHLAEKSTEDLQGTFGRNKVRREMQDYFNEVLFEDGIERVQDVLFNEFFVQ